MFNPHKISQLSRRLSHTYSHRLRTARQLNDRFHACIYNMYSVTAAGKTECQRDGDRYNKQPVHGLFNNSKYLQNRPSVLSNTFSVCNFHSGVCNKLQGNRRWKSRHVDYSKEETVQANSVPLVVELMSESSVDTDTRKEPSHFKQLETEIESVALLDELEWDEDVEVDDDEDDVETNEDDKYVEEIVLDKPVTKAEVGHSKQTIEMYGSPDPNIPISRVPCSGCGAFLHCQDPGIPGYMPSQLFKSIPKTRLREKVCQRCRLLKHNIALNVSVTPKEYREIISGIKHAHSLAVLIVDIMDMNNSILKDLPDLIGRNRPLVVIGNKIDLLPRDNTGYLKRAKESLVQLCVDVGLVKKLNIQHVCLVSAKTGYGIEDLITILMKQWGRKGHVYVLGCTNVGKSTLFNALLSSDYCKAGARDFINRATTSLWPGTTLNLLKFPIVRPTAYRLHHRTKRLMKERSDHVEEEMLRKQKLNETGRLSYATLMGHIGQTFVGTKTRKLEQDYSGYTDSTYVYDAKEDSPVEDDRTEQQQVHEQFKEDVGQFRETMFQTGKWCYDTPGVVNPAQIINLLNQEELSVMLANKLIRPRSLVLKPGQVMFVSGLGRIDYVQGPTTAYFTALVAANIPLYVVDYPEADDFYIQMINSGSLVLPVGGKKRLREIPALIGKEMSLIGRGWKESTADIVLSSLGWVSVTGGRGMQMRLRAYTPGGAGCLERTPLLPYAVNLRGKRIGGTPAYQIRKPWTET